MSSIFAELKRRNVFKVGIAYAIVAWLLIQIAAILFPTFNAPAWVMRVFTAIVILGFPLTLIITWAFELTPEGVKRTESEPKNIKSVAGIKATISSATTDVQSIAVMPFVDMSPDKDQEYFADGLSEELLNKLARLKDLYVAGRTSSFHFKGRNEDLRIIGETLGVAHVLEGSVRKSGDKVRITAQLINTRDGYHLWSHTFDRQLEDIFAIQDEIAEAVATSLSVALGVGDLGQIEGGTRNVEAFDTYLYGQGYLTGKISRNMILSRIDALERAVTLDPDYALAWARLAGAYEGIIQYDSAAKTAAWFNKADQALARAVELAPDAVQVLARTAHMAAIKRKWVEAEHTFRKALDLHGDRALALDFSRFLIAVGKCSMALNYVTEAHRIEPFNYEPSVLLSGVYGMLGKTTEALAEIDHFETISEPHAMARGLALMLAAGTGDRREIEHRLDLIIEVDELNRPIHVAMKSLLDDGPAALTELRRMLADMGENHFNLFVLSHWAAYFGDDELALTLYKEVYTLGGYTTSVVVVWCPIYREMRKLPGFKDFVRDVGLVDYWRGTGWGDFCHPAGDDDFECE